MGDRANVVVEQYPQGYLKPKQGRIFLYTHWGGSELPAILQAALIRGQGRWQDDSYLTRIIFNEMTRGQEYEETGFGISTTPPDNEHDFLVVDCRLKQVRREDEFGHNVGTWSFDLFCKLNIEDEFKGF